MSKPWIRLARPLSVAVALTALFLFVRGAQRSADAQADLQLDSESTVDDPSAVSEVEAEASIRPERQADPRHGPTQPVQGEPFQFLPSSKNPNVELSAQPIEPELFLSSSKVLGTELIQFPEDSDSPEEVDSPSKP